MELTFKPVPDDIKGQLKKMKLKKPMIGGELKKGTVVWVFHRIRMYIPKPKTGSTLENLNEAAAFDVGSDMYEGYFEPVE